MVAIGRRPPTRLGLTIMCRHLNWLKASIGALCLIGTLLVPSAVSAWTGSWLPAKSMNVARIYHSAVLLPSGKVLVAGGSDGVNALSSVELYDPVTDSWKFVRSMNSPRTSHSAVLLADGTVLVAGGLASIDFGVPSLRSSEIYNPSTDVWQVAGSMTFDRQQSASVLVSRGRLAGKVLVAGGLPDQCCGLPMDTVEIFDPALNSWSTAGVMLRPRFFETSSRNLISLGNGKIFVVGGTDADEQGYNAVNEAETYNPLTRVWSEAIGKQSFAQDVASKLIDGRVLVAGGAIGRSLIPSADAEIYDPVTQKWSKTTSLPTPAKYGHLVRLMRGRILSTGGQSGPFGQCINRIHSSFYVPLSSKWVNATDPAQARYGSAATVLKDGHALITGGTSCAGLIYASTELYIPG